jgi:hypothetical protein
VCSHRSTDEEVPKRKVASATEAQVPARAWGWAGREGEGGGRRVVEVERAPVGKRRSIITTVPAHGDLSPRARIYSLCSWSIV